MACFKPRNGEGPDSPWWWGVGAFVGRGSFVGLSSVVASDPGRGVLLARNALGTASRFRLRIPAIHDARFPAHRARGGDGMGGGHGGDERHRRIDSVLLRKVRASGPFRNPFM